MHYYFTCHHKGGNMAKLKADFSAANEKSHIAVWL